MALIVLVAALAAVFATPTAAADWCYGLGQTDVSCIGAWFPDQGLSGVCVGSMNLQTQHCTGAQV